jgi:hypothetical protein
MAYDDAAFDVLPCPHCGERTSSLKQYRYVRLCVCLGFHASWHSDVVRACPYCIRRVIWRRCLLNIVPANLLWPFLVLPWAVVLTAVSHNPGHSADVLRGVTPEMIAIQDAKQRELSWPRVNAILAILTWWVPLLGLFVAAVAWLCNRRSPSWTRSASKITLIAALLVNGGLMVLAVLGK